MDTDAIPTFEQGVDECYNCSTPMDDNQATTSEVCWDCWVSRKTRWSHEQTILDALEAISDERLHMWQLLPEESPLPVIAWAVLALRESKS